MQAIRRRHLFAKDTSSFFGNYPDGFFDENTKRRVVENADTGISVEIGWRGIKETFGKGKKYQYLPAEMKKLKVATMKHLPDIIRYGEVVESGVNEYHNNNPDLKYTYIQHPITVDGKTMYVVVDIRQSKQTNMFWVHGVYLDKKTAKSLVTSTDESVQAVNKDLAIADTVAQTNPVVKMDYSLSDSKEFNQRKGSGSGKRSSCILFAPRLWKFFATGTGYVDHGLQPCPTIETDSSERSLVRTPVF